MTGDYPSHITQSHGLFARVPKCLPTIDIHIPLLMVSLQEYQSVYHIDIFHIVWCFHHILVYLVVET